MRISILLVACASLASASTRSDHWVGTGHQYDDDSHWTIDLRFDPDVPVGSRSGTIAYPSLKCSGELTREADEGDFIILREHITTNPEACIDGGTMVIPRVHGDTFHWRWRYPSNKEGADATLRRSR